MCAVLDRRVAQLKDLDCLNRTSRHLSSFLVRRAKYVPLLPKDLAAWIVDLSRIITQFGANVLDRPDSIYTLTPPFCPRNSAIHRQLGYAEDGIKLVSAWSSGGDDRICSLSYNESYATVVAAKDHRFAVGLNDGLARIYSTSTCEELATLTHGESILALEFGPTSKFIASAGLQHVKLWETATGAQLFDVETDSRTLALAFSETESWLTIASREKHLAMHRIPDGLEMSRSEWTDPFAETKDYSFPLQPFATRISVEQQVMAVTYRGRPVQLWSLKDHRPIGACIAHP